MLYMRAIPGKMRTDEVYVAASASLMFINIGFTSASLMFINIGFNASKRGCGR